MGIFCPCRDAIYRVSHTARDSRGKHGESPSRHDESHWRRDESHWRRDESHWRRDESRLYIIDVSPTKNYPRERKNYPRDNFNYHGDCKISVAYKYFYLSKTESFLLLLEHAYVVHLIAHWERGFFNRAARTSHGEIQQDVHWCAERILAFACRAFAIEGFR